MTGAKANGSSGGRLFAVGDLHGCPAELAALLKTIAPGRGDTIVFIGDYVDRGFSSKEVVEQLLELERGPACAVFLKGNHEDMLLSFLGLPGKFGEWYLLNGGLMTAESYGAKSGRREELLARMPPLHLDFFKRLRSYYQAPPYLFVHAGVAPGVPLEHQSEETLLWVREQFLAQPHGLGATVVFGHTPQREVALDLPERVGIDTGLVFGGKLSCIEFTEGMLYQVPRGRVRVQAAPIALR